MGMFSASRLLELVSIDFITDDKASDGSYQWYFLSK